MARPRAFDEAEVLHKAMLLFWQRGYHPTSIKDLIEVLGISNASIYNTFGGKQQLFQQALEHYRQIYLEGFRKFTEEHADVRAGLRALFHRLIEDDQLDPDCKGCFLVNVTTELAVTDAHVKALVQKHKQEIEGIFQAYLQQGVEAGQIGKDKDLREMAQLFYALMTGLRVLGKGDPDPAELEKHVGVILGLLD